MKRVIFLIPLFISFCTNFAVNHEVVFGHGFGATRNHGLVYGNINMFPNCNVTVFDFPDSPARAENRGRCNSAVTSLGQENENTVFEQHYNELLGRVRDYNSKRSKSSTIGDEKKIIVGGVSRGAMNALSSNFEDVNGIFAESPAATVQDIVDLKCKQFGFGWVPFLSKAIHRFIVPRILGQYNPQGPHPVNRVDQISSDVPVFIAYTTQDKLIPASSSVKLAQRLVSSGHNNVYLWGTNSGLHSNILSGRDGRNYQTIFHAFLRQCTGEPGNASQNHEAGDRMLAESRQTSIEDLVRLRSRLEGSERYWKRNLVVFSTCLAFLGLVASRFIR